jgi:hypothetical protein
MQKGSAMSERESMGNASDTVNMADGIVTRPTGPWSDTVHDLLRHLEHKGFNRAPRFLGVTADGREMLDFMEGQVGHYPLPSALGSDDVLRAAAQLLRDYHDATASFVPNRDAIWRLASPSDLPIEVICHNDFAPYNCVFRHAMPVAMIDFDVAAPGSRAWDLAYTAFRFVPLAPPAHRLQFGFSPGLLVEARLVALLDAYGLDDRSGFVELVERRVVAIREFTAALAEERNAAGERVRRERHLESYDQDLKWLSANAKRLRAATGDGVV